MAKRQAESERGGQQRGEIVSFGERLKMVKAKIETDENYRKLETAKAGPTVEVQHYIDLLWKCCAANVKVLNCSVESLYIALLESIMLGLPVGSSLGYGYVVPYKGQAQFQAGYLGLLRLAYNEGGATTAAAEVVRAGDHFDHRLGSGPKGEWPFAEQKRTLASDPNAEIEWAWAQIWVKDGPPFVEVWPASYLTDHAKKYIPTDREGKYYSDALIVTNYEMWCRKTMLRRAVKLMPMSPVAKQVLQREEWTEAGYDPDGPMQSGDEQTSESLRDLVSTAPPIDEAVR